ncbi:MAG: histidine phosphatase family protein [Thermodesulfovibrionales bacterium]|nr:histidine phosphatase family protein [Thermodesulfovibrionales bacterium]
MVKTLYIIRHGVTEGDGIKRYKGSMDVLLSERGIRQMERVAFYLRSVIAEQNLVLYSSPLKRALKSAEIIGKEFGLTPVVIEELKERNFGLWEGMSYEEIMMTYPEEFEAWRSNPLRYSPPGGESTIEVRDRVMKGLKKIEQHSRALEQQLNMKNNNPASNVSGISTSSIIVAHGGVNRVILCEILGIPLENIFRIEQEHACINVIQFHDGYPVVKLLNFTLRD